MTTNFDDSALDRPPQEPRTRRFRTLRVVAALILRETGSRETRTSLGFLWQLIDPIATVALLSLAFGIISRTPRLGTNFPLYYITGVAPFQLYTQISGKVSSSPRFSRALLGFPSVTVLDSLIARFVLNAFTNVVVFVVLVVAIILYYGLRLTPDPEAVMLSLTMAAALGLGIGTLNSVLFLASPTYESLFSILNRPLFLMSGVMFLINDLPEYMFKYLKWNPIAQVVGEMRHAFYPGYDASYVVPAYVFMISAVSFMLGLIGLQRYVFDALDR